MIKVFEIIAKNKITSAILALSLPALLVFLSSTPSPDTEKTVPSPSVAVPADYQKSFPSKKTVKNLNFDPQNIVLLNTEINEYSVEATIKRIQENEEIGEDLTIALDCPGGSVFDGNRLISYMEGATIKINTVVYGLAASMCAHIHAHGNKRYAVDRATLMYHQASGGIIGNLKGMKHLLTYIEREVAKLDAYIADRSGISREEFDELVENDLWISADDALEMGLVDELVTISVNGETLHSQTILKDMNMTPKPTTSLKDVLKDIR